MTAKIQAEIWSDVVCPFCYIGKRHFEAALAQFSGSKVEVIWKSFQLNPELTTDASISIYESLSQSKGWSMEQTKNTSAHVTAMAAKAGLTYEFDRVVVANTFNAHRLLHFAKGKGLQGALKEMLLKAYFTDGKNIDDTETLVEIGTACGLNAGEIRSVIVSSDYEMDVKRDLQEASQIGVRGVPYFVFDRKYALSGAQPVEEFLQLLQTLQKEKTAESLSS